MKKIVLFILAFNWLGLAAQENAGTEEDRDMVKTVTMEERSITLGDKKLSLNEAIVLVLKKNLTLRSARYDVIMSDSDLRRDQKKYAPVIEAEGSYYDNTAPVAGTATAFGGNETYQFETSARISKLFSTGTSVSIGVKEIYTDSNDNAIPSFGIAANPPFHKPALFVTIQQELLRNAFGYAHRKKEQMLYNSAKMARRQLLNQLSGLVVEALIDYWQVTVDTRTLENTKEELRSTIRVRNIIARNIRLGLAERFDLNQYNALVASAESKVAIAEQTLKESVRRLLRKVNMDPSTEVKGLTDLVDELPSIDKIKSVEAAMKKRVDYKNALMALENSKLQIQLARNNALPSLTISGSYTSNTQDEGFGSALSSIPKSEFPEYRAGVKMSYPLWDEEIKTNVRNAYLAQKQAKIKIEDLKQEIRDEVLNRLEQVGLQYTLLQKNREVREESEKYYRLLLARSRQGKFNAVAVKDALDSRISARQRELESLIQYNVALLRLDLAKNEVFERYKVDIEKLLQEVD